MEWAEGNFDQEQLSGAEMSLDGRYPPCPQCHKRMMEFSGTPARLVGARHEIALPGRRDEARIVLDAVEALRFASSRFAGALAGGLDRICARRDEVRRGRRAGCLRRGLGAVL